MAEANSSTANSTGPVITNSTIALNPPNQIITINAATQLPLKLTKINYPLWRVQHQSLLFGNDLEGYIDGSLTCPPSTISNPTNTGSISNPAYRLWKRQDSLIFHAMLASVSDSIVPLITSSGSAAEASTRLEQTYASKSYMRIMGLWEILDNTTTENMSIDDYMQTVKSVSETLALAGSPMSDAELIHATLKGLGPEFKSLSDAIRACDSLISFEELHDKLADHELTSKCTTATTLITVQYNQRNNSINMGHNLNFNNNTNMNNNKNNNNKAGQKFSNKGNHTNRAPHGNRNGFQSGRS